jgi:hypothetical protein
MESKMTWKFSGNRSDFVIELSDEGHMLFHGWPKSQDIRPTVITSVAAIRRIESAKCIWTLCLPSDFKEIFSADMLSKRNPLLAERIKKAPERRHGSIKFFDAPVASVGLTLVAAHSDYQTITRLFELVTLSDSIFYHLSVNFIGFPVAPGSTGDPTEVEFLSGDPLAIDGFSLSIGKNAKDE